jgi:hypothetical protein
MWCTEYQQRVGRGGQRAQMVDRSLDALRGARRAVDVEIADVGEQDHVFPSWQPHPAANGYAPI